MESEYLEWVRTRKFGRFNLASSGVLPCLLAELDAHIEDLEINGPGLNGYPPLQEAIAAHCGVPVGCVVAASGTSTANFIAMAALTKPGDEVLIEQPVYDPLLALAHYLGANVRRFPRDRDLRDVVSGRTKVIVVTNLHNPTCQRLTEEQLTDLGGFAKDAGASVLVDEVYLECMYEKRRSAFHLGDDFVCTGSLTKAYGLGGLRCGWIIARPDLAERMWRLKDLIEPSVPHPAEQLSVMAFAKLDRLARRAKAFIDPNRALLVQFLRSCPHIELEVPEYGTCVFPRIMSGGADRLFELLHDRYDTDVVPGRFFEMPGHFRIGLGGDNEVFAAGLQRVNTALEAMM